MQSNLFQDPHSGMLRDRAGVIPVYLCDAHCHAPDSFIELFNNDDRIAFIQEHWMLEEGAIPRKDKYYDWAQAHNLAGADIRIFSIGNFKYSGSGEDVDCQYVGDIERALTAIDQFNQQNPGHHFTKIIVNTGHSYPIGVKLAEIGFEIIDCQPNQEGFSIRERHETARDNLSRKKHNLKPVQSGFGRGFLLGKRF